MASIINRFSRVTWPAHVQPQLGRRFGACAYRSQPRSATPIQHATLRAANSQQYPPHELANLADFRKRILKMESKIARLNKQVFETSGQQAWRALLYHWPVFLILFGFSIFFAMTEGEIHDIKKQILEVVANLNYRAEIIDACYKLHVKSDASRGAKDDRVADDGFSC